HLGRVTDTDDQLLRRALYRRLSTATRPLNHANGDGRARTGRDGSSAPQVEDGPDSGIGLALLANRNGPWSRSALDAAHGHGAGGGCARARPRERWTGPMALRLWFADLEAAV